MPTTQASKDWFDYVSALTPSLVALLVAYIAYRQWRIARHKLRLDLYGKRFAVFEATLRFYQELLGGSGPDKSVIEDLQRKFITAMIEARFLFAPSAEIKQLMGDFNKSAFVIKGSWDVMKTQGIPPEMLLETSARLTHEQTVLESKLDAIEKAMAPYLSFRGLVD